MAFYETGRGGLLKSDEEAARLYRLAADQGNTNAQVMGPMVHRHRRPTVLCAGQILFLVLLLTKMGQPGVNSMKSIVGIMAGAIMVTVLGVAASPAISQIAIIDAAKKFHGAPGPIAGAGLPVVAVGLGIYWLVRRRRRKAE